MLIWVLVFAGIALAGIVLVLLLVRMLMRKASALFAELDAALGRLDQLAELVAAIELPDGLPADRVAVVADGVDHSDLTVAAHRSRSEQT